MKLFKCIVMLILILITIRTGYLALLYKVSTSTGAFLICLGITLFVVLLRSADSVQALFDAGT